MDQPKADRLAELFEDALALPPGDRRRYAREACGDDPDLCSELVSLLGAYEEAPEYLERIADRLPLAAFTPAHSFDPSRESERAIEYRVDLQAGQRFGHYVIGRFVGRGGMSEVWEAEDLATGRHVALKTLDWTLRTAADRARFLREGRLAASVNHRNIVYVFGTEEIEGVPVIAMELASGGTLKDLVAAAGPMRPARAVDVVLQVIEGLQAAAAAGVLHRDIKPSNCFVDAEERIQVGDFGIAVTIAAQGEGILSAPGHFGTPAFASPEQLRGEPLDVRSDIYAVGATLHYLLTGRPPFEDANVGRLIERALNERPASVRAARRDVPRALDGIIRLCLAKNPAGRPQSYAHLSRLLLPYGPSAPVPAPLGLRAIGGLCDGMFVRHAGALLAVLALQRMQRGPVSSLEWLAFLMAHSSVAVAYFGLTEAIWGASPGKMIVGLRVIRTDRHRLGVSRSFARAFLWWLSLTPGIMLFVALSRLGQEHEPAGLAVTLSALGTAFCGIGLLFGMARRANGYAGLHDLATQTRVVLKPAVEPTLTRRFALEAPPVLGLAPARLGPYLVLDEAAAPGVVVGFDPQLARRVWIRRAPPGTPAVPLTRRTISRPTRLRWLNGSRDGNDAWDAYESAAGEPLLNAIRLPRSWGIVRGWLEDLARELMESEEDGTCLPLAVERVWITEARAKFLDWVADDVKGAGETLAPIESRDVQRFLYDVAMLGLGARQPGSDPGGALAALPLHARHLLHDLASERFETTTAIVERLRSVATRPVTVTRARRRTHMAMCGMAPLMNILNFIPVLVVVIPFLAQSPDALLLEACLQRLGRLERSSSADAMRELAAVETYLVGRFRPLLTARPASGGPWIWAMIEARQPAVQRALARHPNPSDDEIERAAQQLAGLIRSAERHRELAARGLLGWPLLHFQIVLLIATSAVPAVVSAFAARGGVLFRLLGIAIVDRDGREVSRLRACARALFAWTPGLAALVVFLPATDGWMAAVPLARLAPSILLLAVFVAGAVFAVVNVNRGLQDRIVGTSLVAR